MKVQPGIHPQEMPRSTGSHGEIEVYNALKSGLPRTWYAWHSLRLMDGGRSGEGDFVIAAPGRGFLALEVKGGNIEQRDGRWFQNGVAMKHTPRSQAFEFVRKLVRRLERAGCSPPAYGVGTCFPDVAFDAAPDEDDLNRTTIGKRDLPWIGERLQTLIDYTMPPPRPARGEWIEQLHKIWGETWLPSLALCPRERIAESHAKLDECQILVLSMLERAPYLLVEGGAGTGKTLIAREAARRFAEKGARVLMVCFTNALADWIRRSIDSPGVEVWALGKLALEYARRAHLDATEPKDKEGWDSLLMAVTERATPTLRPDWDFVVLDEAQDFSMADWMFALELAKGKRLWVFHDPGQHFWPDRPLPAEVASLTPIVLPDAYRCPAGILALANCYRDNRGLDSCKETVREALQNGTIGIVSCPSVSSIRDKIANEIAKFRSAGFRLNDIAIVSVRGQTGGGTFGLSRIGAYRLVAADDPRAESEIIDDTFLRFKGLERPAVIVTDLHLIREPRAVRMYIALTRALAAVRIVAPRESFTADRVMNELLQVENAG